MVCEAILLSGTQHVSATKGAHSMLAWVKYLDRVIRGDANHPTALAQGEIHQPVGGLTVIGAVLGGIYGLCMGCFGLFARHDGAILQMIATTIKVPLLFFLTLAITFP